MSRNGAPPPARRRLTRRTIVASILVVAIPFVAGIAFVIVNAAFRSTHVERAVVADRALAVRIRLETGDVTVRVGPSPVEIEFRERYFVSKPDPVADVVDGALEIEDGCPTTIPVVTSCAVDVIVTVLPGTRLDVRTRNGDITGDGLTNPEIVAATANGDIELRLAVAAARVRAESAAGDVSVVTPDGPFRVRADTLDGDVRVGVPEDPAAPRTIDARAATGDVSVLPSGP